MSLISVDHVSKRFPLPDGKGEFTVLEDVSLTVRSSEVVALLGRSGSGKSTLLRIMSGLIRPSQGTVRIKGSRCGEPTPIWPWCSRASRCFPGSRCRTTWNWVWPPGMSNATSAGNAPSRPSTSSASMVSRMRTPGSSPAG